LRQRAAVIGLRAENRALKKRMNDKAANNNKTAPRAERIARVKAALAAAGLDSQIRELSQNTATAKTAAIAVGCEVGQIVKSLVFRRQTENGEDDAVLALVSGAKRADMDKLANAVPGTIAIAKADADFVKQKTGFEIGGVPPLGFADARRIAAVVIAADLLAFDVVWAAAGSAFAVFPAAPRALARAAGAISADISED
jgi:prolyl-tRNA editing enzyme YbaK/EbsC (Cys-tRNA(Pro) deacylase)